MFKDHLAVGLAVAGAAAGELGSIGIKMGEQYAVGTNNLIRETGAAGDKLKGLQQVMVNVAKQVPEGMDEVGAAAGRLNVRLGLTGPALQGATKTALDFARVNKVDVTTAIDLAADAMARLHLPVAQLPELLDKITKASQLTGINVDDLASSLATVGPALLDMGFSLNGSIALLAQFHQDGGDTTELAKGLNKAFLTFAKEGATDGASALQILVDKVKAAPNDLAAAGIAADIFGAKVGDKMARQIRDGTFDIQTMTGAIADSGGTIDDTATRTATFGDDMKILWNNIAGFIGPVLGQFGELGSLISNLTPLLPILGGAVGALGKPLVAALLKIIPDLIPAAVATGTATGAAEGEAHAATATGSKALQSFLTKFGLLTPAKVAASTGAGTLEGAAEGEAAATAATGPAALAKFTTGGGILGGALGVGITAAAAAALLYWLGSKELEDIWRTWFAHPPGGFGLPTGPLTDPPKPEGGFAPTPNQLPGIGVTGLVLDPATGQFISKADTDRALADWLSSLKTAAAGFAGGISSSGGFTPSTIFKVFGLDLMVPAFASAGHDAVTALEDEVQAQVAASHKLWAFMGADGPRAYSEGIHSAYTTVFDAFAGLKTLMHDALSPAAEEAKLIGIATSKRLAKALRDGRPEVRGAGQQIALDTIAELQRLDPKSAEIGRLSTKLLAGALPNELPYLRDQIKLITGAVTTPLGTLPAIAARTGRQIDARLAAAIDGSRPLVVDSIDTMLRIITNRLQLGSPAKEGPWSKDGGPIAWAESAGSRMVGGLARSIRAGMPDLASAVGDAAALTAGIVSGAQPRLAPAGAYGWATAAEQIMARAQFPDFAPAYGARAITASVGSLELVRPGPVVHSGTVRHVLEVSPATARAFHGAGYSISEVASLMATVGEELGYQSTRHSEAPRY